MAYISLNEPISFNENMEEMTVKTPAHADQFNNRYTLLMTNDAALKNEQQNHFENTENPHGIIAITNEEINKIDSTEVVLPDYEADVSIEDIDYILAN